VKEDELTNSLIKMHNDFELETDVTPEAHYNHYGSRGIADLYVHQTQGMKTKGKVYEVKSNPDNANEVVRQFNKMCKYFYKGSERGKPNEVTFELVFTAEPSNLRHVYKNKEMYSLIADKEDTIVTFRHPKNISPVHIFAPAFSIGDPEWLAYVKRKEQKENLNPEDAEKLMEAV